MLNNRMRSGPGKLEHAGPINACVRSAFGFVAGLSAAGLLAPPLVSRVIAAISRWRTGSDLERLPDVRARSWWLAVGLALLAALVAGGSAVCVLRAFGMEQAFAHWSLVWASYTTTASVGILAIFAPSGLGVREALLLLLFSHVASPEVALLPTLSLRGLEVVIDLLYFGLSLCATRWARWRREELTTR